MLTEEQRLKGRIALLPTVSDLEKSHALELHKRACEGMTLYGLPFRVYLDYLKKWDNMTPEERYTYVDINPCYPDDGYPLDRVRVVTPDDIDLESISAKVLPFDNIYTLKKTIQNEINRDIVEPLRKWKILDNNWKKYFSHLLVGYDFERFTEFDFNGGNGTITPEDLGLLRKLYARVLAEYEERVLDDYLTEEPRTTKERKRRYTDKPYRVLWDKDTIKERETLTERLGIEPFFTDEEYNLVFGTDDNEDCNADQNEDTENIKPYL